MKRITITLATAALLAGTAYAGSTTVKFERDDGTVQTATFNEDGTVISDAGVEGTYKMDEDAKEVCIESEQYDGCITFEETKDEVGASTGYTTNEGKSGTATITAMEE